mmetsp:Transcript_13979/g.42189  ORF Transcript_13979/g.42189 Transcript_13979/m.42189 type:complete len:220 (+) Transcript_13979:906-1565(+)
MRPSWCSSASQHRRWSPGLPVRSCVPLACVLPAWNKAKALAGNPMAVVGGCPVRLQDSPTATGKVKCVLKRRLLWQMQLLRASWLHYTLTVTRTSVVMTTQKALDAPPARSTSPLRRRVTCTSCRSHICKPAEIVSPPEPGSSLMIKAKLWGVHQGASKKSLLLTNLRWHVRYVTPGRWRSQPRCSTLCKHDTSTPCVLALQSCAWSGWRRSRRKVPPR